jgi:hypothetical protein
LHCPTAAAKYVTVTKAGRLQQLSMRAPQGNDLLCDAERGISNLTGGEHLSGETGVDLR